MQQKIVQYIPVEANSVGRIDLLLSNHMFPDDQVKQGEKFILGLNEKGNPLKMFSAKPVEYRDAVALDKYLTPQNIYKVATKLIKVDLDFSEKDIKKLNPLGWSLKRYSIGMSIALAIGAAIGLYDGFEYLINPKEIKNMESIVMGLGAAGFSLLFGLYYILRVGKLLKEEVAYAREMVKEIKDLIINSTDKISE